MANFNKISLIGRTGQDAELRMTPTGKAVASCSIAVNRWSKPGEPQKTDWFRLTWWGTSAERAAEYITKGRLIFIEGTLEPREYVDKAGVKQISLDVQVREWQLLDKRPGTDAPTGSTDPEERF